MIQQQLTLVEQLEVAALVVAVEQVEAEVNHL